MMHDRFLQKTSMLVLFTAFLLTGCGSSPPPVEFYTLNSISAMTPQVNPAAPDQNITIGIGPIEIPEILDRPQIVTRTGPNKLKVDEFNRWAGPLKAGFGQVLAENISLLLATDRVAVYPWEIDFKPDSLMNIVQNHLGNDLSKPNFQSCKRIPGDKPGN